MPSSYDDETTAENILRFWNQIDKDILLLWVDFEGREVEYARLCPGGTFLQSSFTTHVWRITSDDGSFQAEYIGETACLEIKDEGLKVSQFDTEPVPKTPVHALWGEYKKRGDALGLPIMAYDCVSIDAVHIAEKLVRHLLERTPPQVLHNLLKFHASVAIIGRHQVTTDIPAHAFMKHSKGGRDIDKTTRGLGGTRAVPVTSCGEENLLMEDDRHYPTENILVHEFAHAVMNIGLDHTQRAIIQQLYQQARQSGVYDPDCYTMENADEYWAEGAQAWFDATIRTDVNSGVNTRELLQARDPGLARMLAEVYGDGSWRYPQDSPGSFRSKEKQVTTVEVVNGPASDSGPLLDGMTMDRRAQDGPGLLPPGLLESWASTCVTMPWLGLCSPVFGPRSRTFPLPHSD